MTGPDARKIVDGTAADGSRRYLELIEESSDPELTVLQLSIERIRATDPALAEAVRYAAIPRRFDAEIIAALRGDRGVTDTAERIFRGLLTLPFVLKRRDGAYVFHDATRDLLLGEWCSARETNARFADYNRKLAAYYVERRDRALALDADFDRVSAMLLHANRERHQRIAQRVETEFVQPLLQALYHHTLIGLDDRFEFFSTEFFAYERRMRLSVCRALLQAFDDAVERHPARPDASALRRWIEYYRGRLEQA
ncbi:MAG TPA: hypothetical protein VHV78_01895, partial [Gemmatimonadaceae bacterium]|nr:hypothetical protein [Gemmatimonadaceae bacterium]